MLRYILACFLAFSAAAQAQNLDLTGVAKIRQITIDQSQTPFVTVLKSSDFDTNKIMTAQFRINYASADTANARISEYYLNYNPANRMGSLGAIRYPTAANRLDSVVHFQSKYNSYDHQENNNWVKQYDEKGKLFLETEYTYNGKGLMISSRRNDLRTQTINFDQLERNEAGKITKWTSTDTEFGKETLVRNVEYSYLYDTLLLAQEGYIYNNWNKTTNKYDKNGLQTSSLTETGYRQANGKILRDTKTQIKYKDGRPASSRYTENGKKISSSVFTYTPTLSEEIITSKQGKNKIISHKTNEKNYDEQKRLTLDSQVDNDRITLAKKYIYTDSLLTEYIEIEHKINGEIWTTIFSYNDKGNPTNKKLFKGEKLWQEDQYIYEYHK